MKSQDVEKIIPELILLYKDLHRHPELGFTEHRSAQIIADYLKDIGLEVFEDVAYTGVVGVLDSGKPGKTIMLRADMDALSITELKDSDCKSVNEGKMHACGHDAHMTMLLGAAKLLSEKKDLFSGKIKFVFQPAEEGTGEAEKLILAERGYTKIGGAQYMIQEGVLDDVDLCLVMHVQPKVKTGMLQISRRNASASSDLYRITILGKGGHGAQPQNAIDPTCAAAELITAIHMLAGREISAVETTNISLGKIETPGSVWNAVPDKVMIEGGIRTFNEDIRAYLQKRIEEIAVSICKANRCEAIVTIENGYAPTINNEPLAAKIAESAELVLGKGNVDLTDMPYMTSEDCGYYFQKVPGTLMWLGIGGSDPENAPPLHNPNFQMDFDAFKIGVTLHVENALYLLSDQSF